MPTHSTEKTSLLHLTVNTYVQLLLVTLVLMPSALTLYLYLNQGRERFFHAPLFHEIVIPVAIAFSALVSLVTFRCYQLTGKSFQRWLLMGLLAFTLIYAPHGFLTSAAENNPWLFILFGPASRLIMSICFLIAIVQFESGKPPESPSSYHRFFWGWMAFCLVVDLLIGILALSPIAGEAAVRWSMEIPAMMICLAGVAMVWLRGIRNKLILIYAAGLALFAQSSLAFLLCPAWSHLWWYAHLIFAGGFGLLSYGVASAYNNTGSFEDIYSQEELLEKLRESNLNLERSNRELSQYAHLVSHDLQAPVRHISNFIHFLREDIGDDLPAESKEDLDLIENSALRMGEMIKGILKLSSIHPQGLTSTTVDLNSLVGEIHELFQDELDTLNARLHYSGLPAVQADRALLFQVLQNLVQNAIKYRRPDIPLQIDISHNSTPDHDCIAVTDNGTGFDMAHKEQIFQLFGRLHGEETSGTGAGLAICSKIISLHNGRLDAEAEPGKGATFYVYLPKTPSNPAATPPPRNP